MFDTARTVQVISFVPCGRPPSKGGEFSRRLLAMSGREERRGSNSKNMCFEEFLTIFNSPSNYAYLKALLFLSMLSNFQKK